jgi:hypothetical protein
MCWLFAVLETKVSSGLVLSAHCQGLYIMHWFSGPVYSFMGLEISAIQVRTSVHLSDLALAELSHLGVEANHERHSAQVRLR